MRIFWMKIPVRWRVTGSPGRRDTSGLGIDLDLLCGASLRYECGIRGKPWRAAIPVSAGRHSPRFFSGPRWRLHCPVMLISSITSTDFQSSASAPSPAGSFRAPRRQLHKIGPE